MTKSLVSVAVPAYNHEKFITACLTSIYQQTYPHIELIIIDDGSTDNTFEVAKQFLYQHSDRFSNYLLLRQKNQGVSATSNAVVAAAKGEWVHLIGSDDILYPNIVARTQEAIEQWSCPEIGLIHADIDLIDDSGNIIAGRRLLRKRPPPGIDKEAWRWLFFNEQYIFNPTVALRREHFLAMGGFDASLPLEDLDLWLRLSTRFAIARIPEVLAGYRRHPGNTSRKKLLMLGALFKTYGNFISEHANHFSDKQIKYHYQKHLKYLWHRLRKSHPKKLGIPIVAILNMLNKTPTADDYYNISDRINKLL